MKPAKFKRKILKDYFVTHTGKILKKDRYGTHFEVKVRVSGKSKYPRASIYIDGKRQTIAAHQIVCETYYPIPRPSGIPRRDWKNTPVSVKRICDQIWEVNHIDHNHCNFHPSNLEWVTAKQNAEAWQKKRLELQA